MQSNLQISPIENWLPLSKKPLIIAGPCSAESREQILKTATAIDGIGKVNIFRAGVWKPRTRPDSFEGRGNIALQWLNEAKKQTSLLTAVEVANPRHVEECLKNNVDILWIGARTTVNPFYVQEIAEALNGVNIPVMVKNPLHPDLHLWMGALERMEKKGIQNLIAVHRGFFSYHKNLYRNSPQWELPIELKRLCPTLPIVCDPSHISGKRELIFEVAQTALNLDMDGLMIETHISPKAALSDAEQQLSPDELSELLSGLILKSKEPMSLEFKNLLKELRSQVDEVDYQLIQLLAERMALIEKIGEYKRDHQLTVLQLERWMEILKTRTALGEKLQLHKEFIQELLIVIHKEAIRKQVEVVNNTIQA
jgi:chorismate mutase